MVKVRGPLFSQDASGKFADAVVFQHNIYGVYVRRKELSRKTNTIKQVFYNAEYSNAIETWRRCTQSIRDIYKEGKKLYNLNAMQSFVKEFLSKRFNAVYNYAVYGHTVYGQYNASCIKKTIL